MGNKLKKRISKKTFQGKTPAGRAIVPADVMLREAFSLCNAGDLAAAEPLFQSLANIQSREPLFLNRLGVLAHKLGKSDIALDCLRESVRLEPGGLFYNNLGLVQEQMGDLDGALQSYEQAVALTPDFAPAHLNLGNALQKLDQSRAAVAAYREAIRLQPGYAAAWSNLANMQRALGEPEAARQSCLKALQLQPDMLEALASWAEIALEREGPDNMLPLCDEELGFVGKRDFVYGTVAEVLASHGLREQALRAHEKGLGFSGEPGKVFLKMAMLKKYDAAAGDWLARMKTAYEQATDQRDKSFLCFALGKIYEDLEDYPRSFRYIEEANRLVRASYAYSIESHQAFTRHMKAMYTEDLIREMDGCGYRNSRPIFVVGMPRSGTTLVEQILAGHSRVFGAGELLEFDGAVRRVLAGKKEQAYQNGLKQFDRHDYYRIGREYVAALRKYSATAERVVDKLPQNFQWLGLIRLALPEAGIIHCRRDPMDTCWSIFKNIFQEGHEYGRDLIELGLYYRQYLELMEHWKTILPEGHIHEIEYENLVRDQRGETGKLLRFCNLEWEDNCLDFYNSKSRVLTVSRFQVRQPIYTSSVQKWKRYEKQLQPLFDTLYG